MRRLMLLLFSFGVNFSGSIVSGQGKIPSKTVLLTDAQKLEIVKVHNIIRRKTYSSNMRYMTWDGELAWLAESYGRKCRYRRNRFTMHTKYSSVGENMYASKKKLDDFIVTAPISKWNNEASNFNYNSKTCQRGKTCEHYTQIVWASTFKVGCSMTTCNFLRDIRHWNSIFFICYYATAGNHAEESGNKFSSVYERGLSCSECDKGDYCRHGLCANSERDFIKPPDNVEEKVFTGYIAGIAVLSGIVAVLIAWIALSALQRQSFKWSRCCWSAKLKDANSRRNAGTVMSPRPAFLRSSTEAIVDDNAIPLIPHKSNQLEVTTDSYGTTPHTKAIKTLPAKDKLSLKRASRVSLPKPNHPAPRSPPPIMPAPVFSRP